MVQGMLIDTGFWTDALPTELHQKFVNSRWKGFEPSTVCFDNPYQFDPENGKKVCLVQLGELEVTELSSTF